MQLYLVQEIIDVRNSKLDVDGFSDDELDQILEHLCTSWLSAKLGSFLACGAAPSSFNGISHDLGYPMLYICT